MSFRICSAIAIAMGSLAVTASSVQALPGSQELAFHIYADPADPQSDLVLTIDLSLIAVDSTPTAVAWDVTKVVLTQPDLGSGATVWVDLSPSVDTTGGLWWIKHVDLENPKIFEFVLPPLVEGTGVEQNASNPELVDYAFEGTQYVAPPTPEQPPFENTAAINGVFWTVGQPEPDVVALGESVALIDPIEDDPPVPT